MSEIFFAPSVSNDGQEQLRIAAVRGERDTTTDLASARVISQEIDRTGEQDLAAIALVRIFTGKPVESQVYGGLELLITKLDTADALAGAVIGQLTDQELDDPRSRDIVLSNALNSNENINSGLIHFLGNDSLVRFLLNDNPNHEMVAVEPYETVTDDPELRRIAESTGMTTLAFEHELVTGEPDELGTLPELLSRRCHYALGRLSASGSFEHVLSVLSEDHPVRQPV